MDFPSSHRATQWRQNAQNDIDGEDDHQWETETEEEGDEDADSEPERNNAQQRQQDNEHDEGAAEGEEAASNTHDLPNSSLQGYG